MFFSLIAEKASGMEVQSDQKKNSKPLKEKTTKAERRAIQEAQRAAKAAAKGAFFKYTNVLIFVRLVQGLV